MAAFSSSGFSTDAFSVNAFDFGSVTPPVDTQYSGHGQAYFYRQKRALEEARERLERQEYEEAQRLIAEAKQQAPEINTPQIDVLTQIRAMDSEIFAQELDLKKLIKEIDFLYGYLAEQELKARELDDEYALLMLLN